MRITPPIFWSSFSPQGVPTSVTPSLRQAPSPSAAEKTPTPMPARTMPTLLATIPVTMSGTLYRCIVL
jgi:hypothetical protein